jgi:hypothetical protein
MVTRSGGTPLRRQTFLLQRRAPSLTGAVARQESFSCVFFMRTGVRFARKRHSWRTIMRNYLIPAAALAMIGLTTSASAADLAYVQEPVARVYAQAGPLPLQAAVDIANGMGLISVSNTNKWGNEWQIEGYDIAGSYMEVDVDARTGAILDVDR